MSNPIDNPALWHVWEEVIPAGISGGSKMWECRHCQGLAPQQLRALCPVRVNERLVALERVAVAAYGNDTHSGQQQLKCTLCQALSALDALAAQEATT